MLSTGFFWGTASVIVTFLAMFLSPVSLLEHLSSKEFPTHSLETGQGAIFITGCSSGIGKHAAISLAKEGWDVFATVRSQRDADKIKDYDHLHPLICDVTNSNEIKEARKFIESWLEEKDDRAFIGIVNNAGIAHLPTFLEDTEIETLDRVLDVNLNGPLRVYQAFLPLLRSSGRGRIVNIGSLAGQAARPFRGPYTISKHAIEGLSDTQRMELVFENISVSMVNPGYIATEISNKTLESMKQQQRTFSSALQSDMYEAFQKSYSKAFQTAGTTKDTTAAIRHALFSAKPRTRYYPGTMGVGKLKAWIFPRIKTLLPDRVLDRIVAKK